MTSMASGRFAPFSHAGPPRSLAKTASFPRCYGVRRNLLGRPRPPTAYWHEIDQRIGRELNKVLLDLETEDQALAKLREDLSDLKLRYVE
jgi:hypothetical protein